jgi:hypothetical protein
MFSWRMVPVPTLGLAVKFRLVGRIGLVLANVVPIYCDYSGMKEEL